jgi:hypothetical protein
MNNSVTLSTTCFNWGPIAYLPLPASILNQPETAYFMHDTGLLAHDKYVHYTNPATFPADSHSSTVAKL